MVLAKSNSSIVNVKDLPEHEDEDDTTDMFGIADVNEKGLAKMMQKVKEMLAVAQIDETSNDVCLEGNTSINLSNTSS